MDVLSREKILSAMDVGRRDTKGLHAVMLRKLFKIHMVTFVFVTIVDSWDIRLRNFLSL